MKRAKSVSHTRSAADSMTAKRWVDTWRITGAELKKIRREELRSIIPFDEIGKLCGNFDYRVEPRAPKPTSGLVEQQYWFMKAVPRK
ncbi:MAG TPA: hypothetical protein VI306_11275 [Pyrinomonadaceae bacterium]